MVLPEKCPNCEVNFQFEHSKERGGWEFALQFSQPSPFGKNDHSSSDYPASNSRMVGDGILQNKFFRLLTAQKNQCPWKVTVFFQGHDWKS
jgi:hypothetical protein